VSGFPRGNLPGCICGAWLCCRGFKRELTVGCGYDVRLKRECSREWSRANFLKSVVIAPQIGLRATCVRSVGNNSNLRLMATTPGPAVDAGPLVTVRGRRPDAGRRAKRLRMSSFGRANSSSSTFIDRLVFPSRRCTRMWIGCAKGVREHHRRNGRSGPQVRGAVSSAGRK